MYNYLKRLALVLAVVAVSIWSVGCSTTHGSIGHGIMTKVQLNQANFTIVRSVTGTATADYFFGIGPDEQDLLGLAKRDMIRQAKLKGPQAIVNVTTDIQQTGALFGYQKKAFVSGEVVQFK